jgi:hypothetical protein
VRQLKIRLAVPVFFTPLFCFVFLLGGAALAALVATDNAAYQAGDGMMSEDRGWQRGEAVQLGLGDAVVDPTSAHYSVLNNWRTQGDAP